MDNLKKDTFKIDNIKLNSRLIVGTGKYKNFKETAKAVKESGADMVTVAVRRVNILDKKKTYFNRLSQSKKNNLFTKYSRMLQFRRCFAHPQACKRNGWLEIGKT